MNNLTLSLVEIKCQSNDVGLYVTGCNWYNNWLIIHNWMHVRRRKEFQMMIFFQFLQQNAQYERINLTCSVVYNRLLCS